MPAEGPSTPEGKAIVSQNATRHGLRAAAIVAGAETLEEWQEFHRDALAALAPEGAIERSLATRVAESLWRLRRVPAAEAAAITRVIHGDDEHRKNLRKYLPADSIYLTLADEPTDAPVGSGSTHVLPHERDVNNIVRYEAHLNRQLTGSLHELEALQERRRGNHAPLARVDIDVSGA